MVANTHATQTIDVALAGGVAATGNGTSVRIAALGYLRFDTEAIPQNAIRAIASGAATPVAVWEG